MSNPTYALMGSADRIGVNIFSTMPLGQFLYRAFRDHILLVNIATFVIQIAAIFAIPFLPLARIMLVVYDIMHIAIAALTGIFFYLWMSSNVVFAIVVAYVSASLSWVARLIFFLMLLLSPRAFTIFEAGWYDTHAFNSVVMEAVFE
jgi:hypothetical protein